MKGNIIHSEVWMGGEMGGGWGEKEGRKKREQELIYKIRKDYFKT